MGRNPDMICQGEDIGILGGAFGVTDGLQAKYGDQRVVDMPISEGCIIGSAVGLALAGKTVMAEMQFIDFISCGFDQIVNMMATYHYRTAGEVNLPIVVRGPAGAYGGGALYHSQMNEAWFCNSPGLQVIVPSTPYDAKGLLKAAIRSGNRPSSTRSKSFTVTSTSPRSFPRRTTSSNSARPPSGAPAPTLRLVSYGQNAITALRADELQKAGISAEVIDIRTFGAAG